MQLYSEFMDATKKARFKAQAKIIKALGHPTRLMIVDELTKSERCVHELTKLAEAEMPTVSRHLTVLKEAGILEDQKRGTQVFYRLKVPCIQNFFKCVESVMKPHIT